MQVGNEFGPYVVDKELGSGAMGTVYRGAHQETGAKVAIKLIAAGLAANVAAIARFKREIAILKQLEHPNIVKLLASGKYKGTPFYIMEYVERRIARPRHRAPQSHHLGGSRHPGPAALRRPAIRP